MDDQGGRDDLVVAFEARRRIVVAFEGIAAGSEALAAWVASVPGPDDFARLRAEIDEERTANAQLEERVRSLRQREGDKGRDDDRVAELERSLAEARERIAELEARGAAVRSEVDAVLTDLIPLIEEAR